MRREANIYGTWNSDFSPAGEDDDWRTVLDASATILALHQPSVSKSSIRKLADSYNKRLVGTNMAKLHGVVTKALYETRTDIGGSIFIKVKDKIKPLPKRTSLQGKQSVEAGKDTYFLKAPR